MHCFFDMCCVLSTRSLSCFRTDFYHDWLLSKRNKLHFFAFIMADFYHSYILIFNTMSTTMIMKRKVCSCGYNFIYMYIYWLLILFMNHMDKRNVDWCIPFCIYKGEPSKSQLLGPALKSRLVKSSFIIHRQFRHRPYLFQLVRNILC